MEVIDIVLARRDTLAIMPSGAGKPPCYQLAALHGHGTVAEVHDDRVAVTLKNGATRDFAPRYVKSQK